MIEYIVLENDCTSGAALADNTKVTVHTGFKSVKAAVDSVRDSVKDTFAAESGDVIGVDIDDWGSRYTICQVVKTVKPIPKLLLNVKLKYIDSEPKV